MDNTIFPSNCISTGKYTVVTLLPKNLFEQFKRLANIWFLVVSVLQLLPLELSPTSSWATIAPLALVLTVTLIKDAYMDIRRHRSDRSINSRLVHRWSTSSGLFEPIKWKDVCVSDLLLLSNEAVPADLIILSTSESSGLCYVDTANLDGESNLKVRTALSDTSKIFKSVDPDDFAVSLNKLEEGLVYVEKPNNRLYRFEGCIRLKDHIRAIPIDNTNVVLRGCQVTRTKWVLGLAIFTGEDSKLMMNSKAPPHKRSNVEKRVNRYLFFVFGLLIMAVGLSTLVSVGKTYSTPQVQKYFSGQESASSGLNFITFLILYNGFVPISLYVTMDIVRLIQSKFIQWDLRLYREESDHPAIVKSADLNEDLGQIEYIFSDKTGTLTENRMMFKTCSIRGKVYGKEDEEKGWNRGCVNTHSRFRFADATLVADLNNGDKNVMEFLEILSLCHTVTPGDSSPEPSYQASSPDEEALVIAAHCFGFTFLSHHSDTYFLQINGQTHEYHVLGINEFSSTRKRMSIVLKSITEPHRPAMLLCKGADSVILNLCYIENSAQVRTINQQLYDFSMKGLRTLVLARKEMSVLEAEDFERKWTNAKKAISDREKRLEEVAEEFEVEMDLVGVTAIEDKIQDGVSETISTLRAAGVKIWVLTGDKQETALNIGFSCGLLSAAMTVIILNGDDKDEVKSKLMYYIGRFVYTDADDQHIRRVHSNFSQPSNTPVSPFMNDSPATRPFSLLRSSKTVGENSHVDLENINIGLVINGEALQYILGDKQCSKWFTILACISKAVICCRATPLQKADIVRLVKEHIPFGPLTMSVGDGANDVSMLQEAHVGIGIIGNEGMQAVNCSDYAVARFKYILPLLFLHGRWNYHRVTKVILYSFYKNFLLILPMVYYSFMNAYSGTALYDSWLIMSYNVFFTSLPIIILGTTDTDQTPEKILKSPSLYTSGILHRYFNVVTFLRWILMAVIHSLIILVLVIIPSMKFMHADGYNENFTSTGTISFFIIVQGATLVLFLITKSWTKLFLLTSLGSSLFFYAFIFFYDKAAFPSSNLIGSSDSLFTYPIHLIVMWITPWVMVAWNLIDCFGRQFCRKGDKISPEQTYLVSQPKSVMLRAGKFIKLNQIVSFNGLSGRPDPNNEWEDYSRYKFRLSFRDNHIEKTYQRYQITRKIRFMRVMFWIIFGFLAVWTGIDMASNDRSNAYTVLRMLVLCAMLIFCILAHTRLFAHYYELLILVVIAGGMGMKIASDLLLQNDGSMSTAVVPIITFVLFNVSTFKLVVLNTAFLTAYMLKLIITLGDKTGADLGFFIIIGSYFAMLAGIMTITGYVGYVLEKESRDAFVGRKKLDAEVKRGQEILSNLLPKFVKDRVIMGERDIADDQGVLTILFCDIYDFEEMCEDKSLDLIKFLDNYFNLLDSLVDKHGLTKIETVNKTYMACGGLLAHENTLPANLTEKHHSERVCDLAFDILEELKSVTRRIDVKFSVKIGIHTGQTYSGVVGLHKPQFSLVGDTVNYASRMCAFGMKDRIQISMETFKFVRHLDFDFIPGTAKIKEGIVDTMLIAPKLKKLRSRVSGSTAVSPIQQQPIKSSPLPLETKPSLLVPSNTLITEIKPALDTSQTPLISENRSKSVLPAGTLSANLSEDLASVASVEILPWSRSETPSQRNYREFYVDQHRKSVKNGLWMTICVYLFENAVFVCAFGLTDADHGSSLLVALRLLCVVSLLLLVLGLPKCAKAQWIHWVMIALYAGCSLISVLTLYTISQDFLYVIVLEVMYTNVIYNHVSGIAFKHIFTGCLFILTPWLCIAFTQDISLANSSETSFFIIFFMVLNGAASYAREMQSRRMYILNQKQEEEKKRNEDLLTKLMPKRVYNVLQNDINASPFDTYEKTTILYADICGFTVWAKNKPPKEVVGMLSRLYSAFDRCTVTHQVYKVHTIGDCYVVLGLNDYQDNQRDHHAECIHVVEMAIDMIREIKSINSQVHNLDIGMRIGIHTGTIMGGFAGKIVVRYDIYGPAVTKANKMESGGLKNNINVSEKTRSILSATCPDRFHYVPNEKEIVYEAKGKRMQGYFLDPVRNVDFF